MTCSVIVIIALYMFRLGIVAAKNILKPFDSVAFCFNLFFELEVLTHQFSIFLNMEIDEIKDTILSFKDLLSVRMRNQIHYRSMRNFVLHFDEIKAVKTREMIAKLLSSYIEEIRAKDYDFSDREESFQLARKYMPTLSSYFRDESNFMPMPSLKLILIAGLIIDGILYLTGLSAAYFHIPIATIVFICYYLFLLVFKEPKGRVYGIFY